MSTTGWACTDVLSGVLEIQVRRTRGSGEVERGGQSRVSWKSGQTLERRNVRRRRPRLQGGARGGQRRGSVGSSGCLKRAGFSREVNRGVGPNKSVDVCGRTRARRCGSSGVVAGRAKAKAGCVSVECCRVLEERGVARGSRGRYVAARGGKCVGRALSLPPLFARCLAHVRILT